VCWAEPPCWVGWGSGISLVIVANLDFDHGASVAKSRDALNCVELCTGVHNTFELCTGGLVRDRVLLKNEF